MKKPMMDNPSFEEEEEGWEEEEPSSQGKMPVLCPVCASTSIRLVEMREEVGFYECEECGTTFEEEA